MPDPDDIDHGKLSEQADDQDALRQHLWELRQPRVDRPAFVAGDYSALEQRSLPKDIE